jgi:hypothetical protein
MEQVLPGIGAVPWDALRGGGAPTAALVPQLLVALASLPNDGDPAAIPEDLGVHLASNGLLFQVTPFAVPFLLRIAQDADRPNVAFNAQRVLEDVAYGEPFAGEQQAGNASLMRDVGKELGKAVEFLYRQTESEESRFRAQAVSILAPIDGGSPRFRRLLTTLKGPGEHEQVVEAVRDVEEYLADLASGERPPLPNDRDDELS